MSVGEALRDFLDAEVVLLAAVISSGLRLRPQDAVRDAADAMTMEQALRAVIAQELERRELDVQRYATGIVERALNKVQGVL